MRRNIDGPLKTPTGRERQIDPKSFAFFVLCRKSLGSCGGKVFDASYVSERRRAIELVFSLWHQSGAAMASRDIDAPCDR
jgi:homoserine acetyltransferase